MKRRAEPFFATQSQSATVCAPDSTIISFCPAVIANSAAPPAPCPRECPCQRVAHRGPNPPAVRIPVTSTPFCLKNYFS